MSNVSKDEIVGIFLYIDMDIDIKILLPNHGYGKREAEEDMMNTEVVQK